MLLFIYIYVILLDFTITILVFILKCGGIFAANINIFFKYSKYQYILLLQQIHPSLHGSGTVEVCAEIKARSTHCVPVRARPDLNQAQNTVSLSSYF